MTNASESLQIDPQKLAAALRKMKKQKVSFREAAMNATGGTPIYYNKLFALAKKVKMIPVTAELRAIMEAYPIFEREVFSEGDGAQESAPRSGNRAEAEGILARFEALAAKMDAEMNYREKYDDK
jgi:hypothetical protein